MIKKLFAPVLLISLILFVSGCTVTGGTTAKQGTSSGAQPEPTCNPPYIVKGYGCCLDRDGNKICDTDEQAEAPVPGKIPGETGKPQEIATFIVSRVTDGDTMDLLTGERVRLLGINTPEKGQPYYEEAASRLKELVEGKEVYLEKDVDDRDQYGRLLRHVFINNENVNEKMLKEGLATLYIIPPNVKYESEFREAEAQAMLSEIGLWARPQPGEEKNQNICNNKCMGISYFKWNAEGNDCENLNGEYVTFTNSCPYQCDLTGWTVKDQSSRVPYTFPDNFILSPQSTTTLYTGCGTVTDSNLYWCSSGHTCNAIWNNNGGDTLYLRNQKGDLVLNYHYEGFKIEP